MLVKTCFWKDIRRCIEAVITSTIGNRVVLNGARGFKSHHLRHVGMDFAPFRFFYFIKNQSYAPSFLLIRKKARSARLFACKRTHNGSLSLPPFCELRLWRNILPHRSGQFAAARHFLPGCYSFLKNGEN